jgi:hypothetical protein
MMKKQEMTAQKSTPVKILGSFSVEVCFKLDTGLMPGVSAGYSFAPKAPLLLMSADQFPGKLAPKLETMAGLSDHAVTAVLMPKPEEASWPAGALRQLKIKLRDRFRRHLLCVVVSAQWLRYGTTQMIPDAAPGVSLVLQTTESPQAIVRMQLAIHKRHLRADVWKYHFSAYYVPTPRNSQKTSPAIAAAACMRAGCSKTGEEMRMCPCGDAVYCSDEHAAEAWYAGHSEACSAAVNSE